MAHFISKQFTNNLEIESFVFFGTGEISLKSLEKLAKLYPVEAVFTKPDTINHGKINSSPVKKWAVANSIKVFQPDNQSALVGIFEKQAFTSRLGIVVDYGIIIDESVIDSFELGIINSHFSLLPEWRGADPITFTILSGQKSSGVCLMKIDTGLDTGELLAQEKLELSDKDTSETLTEKLVNLSNTMFEKCLPDYFLGQLDSVPQTGLPTYSRKLTKSDGKINWVKPAIQLEREIRAYKNWPKSYTDLDDQRIVITKAKTGKSIKNTSPPGTLFLQDKQLAVVCGDKTSLVISKLKPDGKKEMSSESYLAGRNTLRKKLAAKV